MSLVGLPFGSTFTFRRARQAPVRNRSGQLVAAAVDEPRLDHDEGGNRLGLLVETGETLGQADRCAVVVGDWEVGGPATVLHEYAAPDGTIVRRAYYTTSPRLAMNALLRTQGHHRIIGAVPTFLRLEDGAVRYRERIWPLAGLLGIEGDGPTLSDGTELGRLLLAG